MFPSYISANWQFPFLRVLSFLFLVHGAEPQLWPLCAILFLGVMSPGRVFSLFFSARLWKSFCFTPMNRIERNLENSSLPLQVSLHFFWITQVSIASRQNIWQEVVPCVLIYRSAPFLVKHPASALFTGSSSPWCLTFRYTFPHPAGKHSLPFGVHFLAAHCRAVAFLHQNLLCPMLSCLCQFVFFFPATTWSPTPAHWRGRWQTVTFSNTLSSTNYS